MPFLLTLNAFSREKHAIAYGPSAHNTYSTKRAPSAHVPAPSAHVPAPSAERYQVSFRMHLLHVGSWLLDHHDDVVGEPGFHGERGDMAEVAVLRDSCWLIRTFLLLWYFISTCIFLLSTLYFSNGNISIEIRNFNSKSTHTYVPTPDLLLIVPCGLTRRSAEPVRDGPILR